MPLLAVLHVLLALVEATLLLVLLAAPCVEKGPLQTELSAHAHCVLLGHMHLHQEPYHVFRVQQGTMPRNKVLMHV